MPDLPNSHDLPILRELGDDLKRAFRDRSRTPAASGRRPGRRSHPHLPAILARLTLRQLASTAASSLSILVVIAIVAVALTLHHQTTPATVAPAARAPRATSTQAAAERALVDELGILRRPQTAAARAFNTSRLAPPSARMFRLIPSSTRLVRLPDHSKLFLYLARDVHAPRPGSRVPFAGLGFRERSPSSGTGACCLSARVLRQPRGAANGDYFASGAHPAAIVYFEIVPDGVAHVRWVFPRHPSYYGTGETSTTTLRPLTVTIAVHDNVAAIKLPQRGIATIVTWLAADGRVIATRH